MRIDDPQWVGQTTSTDQNNVGPGFGDLRGSRASVHDVMGN